MLGILGTGGSVPWDSVTGKPTFGTAALLDTGTTEGTVPLIGAGDVLQATLIPSVKVNESYVVASEAAMLALTCQTNDFALRTDIQKVFILLGADPAVLAHWTEWQYPPDVVQSVDGQTGAVNVKRYIWFTWLANAGTLVTGAVADIWTASVDFNGWNVVGVFAANGAANSSSGAVDLKLKRDRGGSVVDVLSIDLTIDEGQTSSATATAAVVNTSNDDIATGDRFYPYVTGAGMGTQGTRMMMIVQEP